MNDARAFFERATADPDFLLSSLDDALMQADVDELPIITLAGDASTQPIASVEAGVPRHAVVDQIVVQKQHLIAVAICEKGDYCAFKARHKDTIDIMVAVSDAFVSSMMKFPLPVTMIAAYCVRSLTLDRICGCCQDA